MSKFFSLKKMSKLKNQELEVFHFVESSRIRVNFSQWVKGKFQQRKKGANFLVLLIFPQNFRKYKKPHQ